MILCYSKKPPLKSTQAFSLRTQALPIFSNISRLPPRVRDTRESKVPAILRDWHELDAEHFELVPQKKILRERALENTVVETRLCRATLSCSVLKPAWKCATARCPRSMSVMCVSVRC